MEKNRVVGFAWRIVLVAGLVLSSSGLALAQINDSEGANASGSNDSLGTAQNVGAYSPAFEITINGWVDSGNENDVDFYQFTLSAPRAMFFDIDFANDIGAIADNDLGLDAAVSIFDSTGTVIAYNDDSDFFGIGILNQGTDPGSDAFGDRDALVGSLSLPAGTYYVAVAWYDNDPSAFSQSYTMTPLSFSGDSVSDVTPDATFANDGVCADPTNPANECVGPYQLNIRDSFQLGSAIPTLSPLGLLALALGLAVAALGVRRASG